MSAEAAIQDWFDRTAKGLEGAQAIWAGGTDFWSLVDAAADETFENRVKGVDATALDTDLQAGAGDWASGIRLTNIQNLVAYFNTDLSLSSPYLPSYLATKGWRVPYWAAEAYYQAIKTRLAAQYVFGKGTRPADLSNPAASGMHKFQTWVDTGGTEVYTVVDGALVNCYSPVVVTSDLITPGGSAHALTLTLTDGTTKTVLFTPSASQYGQIIVGQEAIGAAGAAAGQTLIPVAATAQFKAATYALLVKADFSVQELVYVASIVTNTSVTATTNLINSFVQNDLVLPLCSNGVRQAGGVANDKALTIWAWPDRIIAL